MLLRIVFAFAFLVLSLTATKEGMFNFMDASKKCEEENHLTNEDMVKINDTKPIQTDNQNIKCYFKCFLLELNLMNSEGKIILEGMTNIEPEYRKYVMECSNTTGVEACDTALNFRNCAWAAKLGEGGF